MEHRMRCKVCGKIWCFTDQDLKENSSNSLMSGIAAIGRIASAFGGTTAQQHLNYDIMERNQAKVVDYYQCPNCRSKDVVELSEEEWEEVQTQESFANVRVSVNASATTEALLTRIKLLLEDKDWPNANAYCDAVLDAEPESAMTYVYKLMAELRVPKQADLANHKVPFDTKPNYQKAVRFADDSLRQILNGYIAHINERNERERLDGLYNNACAAMQQSATEEAYKNAASLFAVIKGHKDADNLQAECLRKAEQARLEAERKATEEKAAAAVKAKKITIIAAIIIVAIVAVVLISNFVKQSNAYNAAVSYYHSGEEIDLDDALRMFRDCDFYKDDETYCYEIRGLIDQLDGEYVRLENGVPDESPYFDLAPSIEYVWFYGFSEYRESANGLVWLVEDGQVISGYTENKEYIFTIVGDEIHVESKVNNDINGTYVSRHAKGAKIRHRVYQSSDKGVHSAAALWHLTKSVKFRYI